MSDYIIHDTTLTSIANAIRTKTGSNAQMTPSEMATAIGNIQGGGSGFTLDDISYGRVTGDVVFNEYTLMGSYSGQSITSFYAPSATTLSIPYTFYDCRQLTSLIVPSLQYGQGHMCEGAISLVNVDITSMTSLQTSAFSNCTSLQQIIAPSVSSIQSSVFMGCTNLTTAIFTRLAGTTAFAASCFFNCINLSTLVLGPTTLVPLRTTAAFNNSSLASGGSGCTIYVPGDLITSYKTATNWKTFDGYGTITWVAIEGSPYEQYKQTT